MIHNDNDLKMKMAMEDYFLIELPESRNPKNKWGAQFVGINGYKQFLPRDEPIMVSRSILEVLDHAAVKPPTELYGRDDVLPIQRRGPISPVEAHQKRKGGQMRVFPERIPPAAEAQLDEMAAKV